jgi:hypothetical protein
MMKTIRTLPVRLRNAQSAGTAYVDRAVSDLRELGYHEVDAISGHWSEVNERLAVARRARDVIELLRDQVDLFPETRARMLRNRARRRALLQGLVNDLIGRDSQQQAA